MTGPEHGAPPPAPGDETGDPAAEAPATEAEAPEASPDAGGPVAAAPAAEAPKAAPQRARRPRSLRRRLAFAAAALALCLLVCLLLLEVGLRLSGWQIRSMHPLGSLSHYHPTRGREHVPGREVVLEGGAFKPLTFRINRFGFRDPHDTPPERRAKKRVVVVGDSFTWGWGVGEEDTFTEKLAPQLGAEVVNMGHNAYGTGQEWLLLREDGMKWKPDVVLVGFFLGNDFSDNIYHRWRRPHFDVGPDGRVVLSNVPIPNPLSERLSDGLKARSLAYFYLSYYGRKARNRIEGSERWYGQLYRKLSASREREKDEERPDTSFYGMFRDPPDDTLREAYRVTEALLGEVKRTCDEGQARLVVVCFPRRDMVEPDLWATETAREGMDPAALDKDLPIRKLAEMCQRQGIEFFDTTPALRAATEAGQVTYLPLGIHWSAEGHGVVADALAHQCDAIRALRNGAK
ncbi:MAG: hypothetical protein AB7N76_08240 [Planctomycetota bacterium]